MILSSYNRLIRYISANSAGNLFDNVKNRRDILFFLNSISNRIEGYLNRQIELKERTVYLPVNYDETEFYLQGNPISSISSITVDPIGLFDGTSETVLESSDYYIGPEGKTINIIGWEGLNSDRGLKIVYTGGLCTSASLSQFNVSSVTGLAVGRYLVGNSSYATGLIQAIDSINNRLTVEVLYGVFATGEVITAYSDEGITSIGVTFTLSSKYSAALCEGDYSSIVTACEMQVRYMFKHKLDFENATTDVDQSARFTNYTFMDYKLRPEVINLIQMYKVFI